MASLHKPTSHLQFEPYVFAEVHRGRHTRRELDHLLDRLPLSVSQFDVFSRSFERKLLFSAACDEL